MIPLCLNQDLVSKENTKIFPDGLHPGTKAYQEWGSILANKIDINISRSISVAGACRPCSPHKTSTPQPQSSGGPLPIEEEEEAVEYLLSVAQEKTKNIPNSNY